MKILASVVLGAASFAAALGCAQQAAAHGGPFVDPNPVGVSSETQREYCRGYSYRLRHTVVCSRYDGKDKNDRYRHRHHERDRDNGTRDRNEHPS